MPSRERNTPALDLTGSIPWSVLVREALLRGALDLTGPCPCFILASEALLRSAVSLTLINFRPWTGILPAQGLRMVTRQDGGYPGTQDGRVYPARDEPACSDPLFGIGALFFSIERNTFRVAL